MNKKKTLVISSSIALILLFVAGSFFYKAYNKKRLGFLATENAALFVRDHSPQMGSDEAWIYLVEFLDPECESCREFYPYVKSLLSHYDGKIRVVIRYAPFHGNSEHAIRILEASREQGKYWETLETLFKYQPVWGSHHHPQPELIWQYLPDIGVDVEKVKADMSNPQIDRIIKQDKEDGKVLGVRSTPTFFVNGKLLEKFSREHLREAIEKELSQ